MGRKKANCQLKHFLRDTAVFQEGLIKKWSSKQKGATKAEIRNITVIIIMGRIIMGRIIIGRIGIIGIMGIIGIIGIIGLQIPQSKTFRKDAIFYPHNRKLQKKLAFCAMGGKSIKNQSKIS